MLFLDRVSPPWSGSTMAMPFNFQFLLTHPVLIVGKCWPLQKLTANNILALLGMGVMINVIVNMVIYPSKVFLYKKKS